MDSGWRLLKGAGGFVAVHPANKWSTSIHQTRAQAEAAADTLERGALATAEKQERERLALREYLCDRPRK